MRKILAIIALIGFGVILYVYLGSASKQAEAERSFEEGEITEISVLYYLENDYEKLISEMRGMQRSPDQLMRFNALVTQIIYSVEIEDWELEKLLELQRMSYHPELVEINPFELQLRKVREELDKYSEYGKEGLKLIDYKIVGPEYERVDGTEYAFMNVLYHLSLVNAVVEGDYGDDGKLYMGYVLEENDEGRWEIKGWKPVDEFLVID